jgi:hypothetical protein
LLPFNFRSCHWASDSENWPNRGLAAGTLQLIGGVPKPCSKSRLAKKFSRLLPKEELKGCFGNNPSKLNTAYKTWFKSDPNYISVNRKSTTGESGWLDFCVIPINMHPFCHQWKSWRLPSLFHQ